DLQARAGRPPDRQIWQSRAPREGIRHGERDRLPDRKRSADRRDDELEDAESHAAGQSVEHIGSEALDFAQWAWSKAQSPTPNPQNARGLKPRGPNFEP